MTRYERRLAGWLALAVGLAALVLYTLTLTPVIAATDSGELILAAWLPGIAHAPGFPLWIVAGYLFSHLLPLGSVAQRLNWMSALCGALAASVTFLLLALHSGEPLAVSRPAAHEVTAPARGRRSKTAKRKTPAAEPIVPQADPAPPVRAFRFLPALVAALCLAFSRTFWSWSVVAEVYALHILCVATVLLLLLAWRRQVQRTVRSSGSLLILAAFLYGLALGNHNLTVGLLAPAILFWLWTNRRGLSWRVFLLAALALGAGLLIYLYLPLRAAQDPLLNWGDPNNLQRLWWHITGKQYRVNIFGGTPATMARELLIGLSLWVQQFTPLAVPLLLGGLVILWRRDRALAVFTLLIVLFGVSYAIVYEIADDRDAYYLISFLVSTVWLATAVQWIVDRIERQRPALLRLAWGLFLLLPILVLVWNWPFDDHRHYTYAADYAANALIEVEPGALILTGDWQLYAPLLTVQHVYGERPDVAVVDVLLFQNRPWYYAQLRQSYPDLLAAVQPQVDAFLVKLQQFEADRLPAGDKEIGPRYQDLWRALLTATLAQRPVYATPDALVHLRQFGLDYSNQVVPGGVLFRVLPAQPVQAPELPALRWNVSAFETANRQHWVLDEPAQKIRRAHAAMAGNRGTYLARLNRVVEAQGAFAAAVEIDPTYTPGYVMLAEALQQLGDTAAARQALLAALRVEPDNVQIQQRLAALGPP